MSLSNRDVLPSEKLISIGDVARGKDVRVEAMQGLAEGSLACTLCYRCTTVCPVGIDLQELWLASREDLAHRGFPDPHVWVKEANTARWAARMRREGPGPSPDTRQAHPGLSEESESFSSCVQCQVCTNVCPVVAYSENPTGDVGVTPQQVMNLLRLGLRDMALGSTMVWDCVTCYMCQEQCPERIRVADILYELRNMAYERFSTARDSRQRAAPARRVGEGEEPEGASP
jgi:heterodisulfide reductase subunit C